MKPYEIIALLESNSGRLFKENILREQSAIGNDELFKGLNYACDGMITFGVKQVPRGNADDSSQTDSTQFWSVANELKNRTLTGHAARDAINELCAMYGKTEWDGWYRRILLKDMACGVSEKTVNASADAKYKIPVFSCQLAHDSKNHPKKMVGRKALSDKLDGVRLLTFVYPDGTVQQYSRVGKELKNFVLIQQQMSTIAHKLSEPYVFDGEVMSDTFQSLMKQVRRESNVDCDDSVLHVFDIIPLSEFISGKFTQSQTARFDLLNTFLVEGEFLPNVEILQNLIVDLDTEEGQTQFKEFNKKALAAKLEGVMAKDLDAIYSKKRNAAWLKLKPSIKVDLVVVDVIEGDKDSEFAGTMGAMVCEGIDDGKFIRVSCGSGFSIAQRAQIWANHTLKPVHWTSTSGGIVTAHVTHPDGKSDIGMVVEVEADAITKSQDSDVWSLRFPRFGRYRGFSVGEKI